MALRMWVPDGGITGWGGNLTEAIRYRKDKTLYRRHVLTDHDLRGLKRQLSQPDSGSFAQGIMDNCYLVADIKSLMATDLGRTQLRQMVEVKSDHVVVWFWAALSRVAVPVRSVFERGVKRLRGPSVPLAAVIESAYATFRLEHYGRLPTMGFSGDTLRDLTGVATVQTRRLLGLHAGDVDVIRTALSAGLPVVASTIGTSPVEYTDAIDFKKRTFDAVVPAVIPGMGEQQVQVRAAHAYTVLRVDDSVTLANPWEYNKLADGTVIRASEGSHAGAVTLEVKEFRRLFGHIGLIPPRSLALWKKRLESQ